MGMVTNLTYVTLTKCALCLPFLSLTEPQPSRLTQVTPAQCSTT